MSAKPPPPTLSLRRPSAGRTESSVPAATPIPRVEPSVVQPSPPVRPAPSEEPPAPTAASVEQPPPARPAPRVAISREAERLTKEPESDFFVSIPHSKKVALKMYCVQRGITMRDWLLGVLAEKGIGTEKGS